MFQILTTRSPRGLRGACAGRPHGFMRSFRRVPARFPRGFRKVSMGFPRGFRGVSAGVSAGFRGFPWVSVRFAIQTALRVNVAKCTKHNRFLTISRLAALSESGFPFATDKPFIILKKDYLNVKGHANVRGGCADLSRILTGAVFLHVGISRSCPNFCSSATCTAQRSSVAARPAWPSEALANQWCPR